MSETATRLPLAEASAIAEDLVLLLEPHCDQLVVCGSIRRLAPTCGDIDLLAVARHGTMTDLFGESVGTGPSLLGDRLGALLADGVITQARRSDGAIAGRGPKLKKLVFRGLPVQIQAVDAECLGMWMVIRTGPSTYSHAFVTPRGQKAAIRDRDGNVKAYRDGMLPPGFTVEKGFRLHRAHVFVPTPTESDVYAALGWRYPAPEQRR